MWIIVSWVVLFSVLCLILSDFPKESEIKDDETETADHDPVSDFLQGLTFIDEGGEAQNRIINALKHVHLALDYGLSPVYPRFWTYQIGELYAQRDKLLRQLRTVTRS